MEKAEAEKLINDPKASEAILGVLQEKGHFVLKQEELEAKQKEAADTAVKNRDAEYYKGIDTAIEELTGKQKPNGKFTSDYVKEILSESKERLNELNQELENLKKAGSSDESLKKERDELKAKVDELSKKSQEEKTAMETNFQKQLVEGQIDDVLSGITLRTDISAVLLEPAKDRILESVRNSEKVFRGTKVYIQIEGKEVPLKDHLLERMKDLQEPERKISGMGANPGARQGATDGDGLPVPESEFKSARELAEWARTMRKENNLSPRQERELIVKYAKGLK